MTAEPTLWVRSDLLPGGQYAVGLSLGEDRAWTLNRREAIAYATAVVQRSMEAEHDAATFRLLTSKGIPSDATAEVLLAARRRRSIDHSLTRPLQFTPGVGVHGPFVTVGLDGQDLCQLTTDSCRNHAMSVLSALAAARLDGNLHRVLIETIHLEDAVAHAMSVLSALAAARLDGNLHRVLIETIHLEDAVARAVIGDLSQHWPTTELGQAPRG